MMRALHDRLRWRRDEVVATLASTDRAVVARAFAYLFGLGALFVVLAPLLPGAQLRLPWLVDGAVVAGVLVAAGVIAAYDRMPERVLRLLPTVGTVLITAVLVGARDDAVPAYALLYFWVALSAFYFFGRQEGLVHLGGVVACFTAVLLTNHIAQGAMLGLMGLGTLGVTGVMLALLRERADTLILSLDAAARTDALTGVLNRRAFDERFGEEIARVARTQRVLALLMLDVDGFKLINDRLGHQAGDRVLQRVAGILRSGRGIDEVARLGGDEFALLLPETDAAGAAELAQRICHRSERTPTGIGPAVELSIGIAAWPAHGRTEDELFDAADSALYAAKQHGGSRAEVFDASMRRVSVH